MTVGEDGVVKYDGVATGVTIPKQGTLTITEMTTDGVTYGWAIKYGNAEPVNLMICVCCLLQALASNRMLIWEAFLQ